METKAAGKALQFRLLLWKNYLIQKRSVIRTILEIGLPTIFALILIGIRQITNGTQINNLTTWSACDVAEFPRSYKLPHKLVYTPNNKVMKRIMGRVGERLNFDTDMAFATEAEMVDFLLFENVTTNNTRTYLGGVVFTNQFSTSGDELPLKIEYKIRLSSAPRNSGKGASLNPFKSDTRWTTKQNFPLFQRVGPREKNDTCGGKPGYEREGFLAIQNAISYAVFEEVSPNVSRLDNVHMDLMRHPYPPYNDDNFVLVIQKQLPLVLVLSFIVIALSIVKDVVHEKERKLKESMKMMGLNNWLHWVAWFLKYFLFSMISIIIMTVFYSIRVGPKHENVIGHTHPIILFLFLMLYGISIICFCFAVSVFFSKANSAAAAGGILFFCTYIPFFFIQQRYDTMSLSSKIAACLDFQVAMAFGGQIIGMFEGTGAGLQFDNFAHGVSVDDDFSMLYVFVMLMVDSVLYCVIAWYVEAVFPGEFGVPQPWYFFFLPSYWCGTSQQDQGEEGRTAGFGQDPDLFEKDPVGIRAGISIQNLSKEFGSGESKKKAVAEMSIDMYEGQITALLGHNGAGKTTTMSMLTGFIPPSGGTAKVNGYDIRRDIGSVRSSLGLCPQHDILFDSLTVEEHLTFFAKLKGVPGNQVKREVETMLTNIGLMPKRKAQSHTLSGGMKRKLSVGIALIGGSKVVILDEPSSGMDPDARRHIWTVLQNNRAGRTMVLTTHFMDEADLLGDRIAIMADGVVKCCGSSLFLKNKYGAGYHMVIVKEPRCVVDAISKVVKLYVPEAELESNIGAELSYILPHESSNNFEALFTQLQTDQQKLGISSFGASITTMEEVFLRVGESSDSQLRERLQNKESMLSQDEVSDQTSILLNSPSNTSINTHLGNSHLDANSIELKTHKDSNNISNTAAYMSREPKRNKGVVLFMQQFYAMFLKRILHTFRNKIVTLSQLIVPLFFTIMALVVIKTMPGPTDSPALKLSIKQFQQNFVPFATDLSPDPNLLDLANFYVNQFVNTSSELTYVNYVTKYKSDPDIIKYLGQKGKESIGTYNLKYLIGATFEPSDENVTVRGYFQNQAYHSPAISLATIASGLLQYFANNSSYSLEVTNHPLPRTEFNKVNDVMTQMTTGFTLAFNVWVTMFNILSGVATILTVAILSIPQLDLQDASKILEWIFLTCLPNFCLGQALEDYYSNYDFLNLCKAFEPFCQFIDANHTNPCCPGKCGDECLDYNTNFLGWEANGIGRMLIFLAIQGMVYFTFVFAIELGLFKKLYYILQRSAGNSKRSSFLRQLSNSDSRIQEDSDVATERARLANTPLRQLFQSDKLILKEIVKDYSMFRAVDHISVGIPQGECFGLLGVNGAGKTTTFKMLTGDEIVTDGNAFLDGFSVLSNTQEVQRRLGYCPQFDALIGQLTGRETLYLFARLRGVMEKEIPDIVNNLIAALLLTEHADKQAHAYSGGNKRKLSTAIALVGNPPIIFLDEPTTGMDPVARRLLWDALATVRDSGRTLILTSHSMEECEALCTRIAIMVNGQFRCLGSTQHLKNKFGEGYTLMVKVAYPEGDREPDLEPLQNFIEDKFPGSVLKDIHQCMLHYHITDTRFTWAQLFGTMERAKSTFNIEDYLVGQTTLEQVFINFARSQKPPSDEKGGCFSWCC